MLYYPDIKIAPSILSADYANLELDLKDLEAKGADFFHIDIMDGHFVPNLTIGPGVVKDIRNITDLVLDVHLMIEDPEFFIPKFIDAGADIINFHVEAFLKENRLDLKKLVKVYSGIKEVRKGLTINPPTDVAYFKEILVNIDLDFILIMSVNPGFGGQAFIVQVLDKVRTLREEYGFKGDIQIDGGINAETSALALEAGCNILVAGNYILKAVDRREAIAKLKDNISNHRGGVR
ncbi:MAG: ribulose-phosphate 3-epimerase [Candidatus Kaelpia aquatica]|nr:ribulose-phosphate 3-epimerase [Candidatus Kaelpia aquatica]